MSYMNKENFKCLEIPKLDKIICEDIQWMYLLSSKSACYFNAVIVKLDKCFDILKYKNMF